MFPWGDTASMNGSIPANWSLGTLKDAGSYPAGTSPYQVLDMAGNAWEWVNDWYQPNYYATSPQQSPSGPSNGLMRVARGGGYTQLDATGGFEYRTTYRLPLDPELADSDLGPIISPAIGFRCVKDAMP
jgi:formylglycine-generating enzyme required for sulfatase activity